MEPSELDKEELAGNHNVHKLPVTDSLLFKEAILLIERGRQKDALALSIDLVDRGYDHANVLVANIYESGSAEVTQDYDRAFQCYSVVAEDANNPIAWINLGRMHKHGMGTRKDLKRARIYFEKAMARGYIAAYFEASKLLREEGHVIAAFSLRVRAVIKAMLIAFKNDGDIRLFDR